MHDAATKPPAPTKAAARRAKRARTRERRPPRGVTVERVATERPADLGDARKTELTKAERRRLADEAAEMAAAGAVDLDRLGVRFLELLFCRWTAGDFAAYPECVAMANGHKAEWSEAQFRAAAAWWASLHPATRGLVVRQTRDCGRRDPIGLSKRADGGRPFARKVTRVPH